MPAQKPFIVPSILAADLANLGAEVDTVLDAGADMIHFDVMDNHYVPNLTFGAPVCASLRTHVDRSHPGTLIDVHLMAKPVDDLIRAFSKAGADSITFHPEASEHIDGSLQLIRNAGCKAALAFNPATPLSWLRHVIDKIDMVLIMGVNPGFGGQSFIDEALNKIAEARALIDASGHDIRLEVDGGVKTDNIAAIAAAGADTLVAGSAIFGQANYAEVIADMRARLEKI